MSVALIIGLGVVLLIVAIALKQRYGTRITTIETRRQAEEEKDRDDA